MKRLPRCISRLTLAAALVIPALSRAEDPRIAFTRYKLDNGLEVMLHRDNRVPLVAVNVWYHVGSGDETPGKSGFAHLFEHMLFQGSRHVGADKHFEILKRVGGSGANGTTNTNRTNYYETMPSHQLEVALWLESDRMGYLLPELTRKSLDNQIEVVRNERRQHYDNVPYGAAVFALHRALYPEGHPYRHLTIGRHEDIASASLQDVKAFYRKWYAPANATLTLAGDFDPAQARRLVKKWFGSFPRTAKPAHVVPAAPVAKRSRVKVPDPFAKLRRLDYAWNTPALYAPGDAELDVLAHALGAPGTGRLYRILVHEKQLAQRVQVYQASRQLSSYFMISVLLKSGADLARVEKIIEQELAKIRKELVTARELKQTIASFESRTIWGLEKLMNRANTLQSYNHFVGTPDWITRDLDRYRKTTREKVRTVARKQLNANHRVEILTVPAGKGGK